MILVFGNLTENGRNIANVKKIPVYLAKVKGPHLLVQLGQFRSSWQVDEQYIPLVEPAR